MKRIVKILVLVAVTIILPMKLQAQTDMQRWIELAENGYITKEESKTAIDKITLQRIDRENAELKLEKDRINTNKGISIVAILAICSIAIVLSTFRYLRKKDEREKEFIMSLADKGVFTQAQHINIDTILPQKRITDSKKFMTDATLIGLGWAIGYSIANSGMDEIFITPANILLALGIMRIIIRTIIFTIEIINKAINKNKKIKEEASTIETTNDTLPEKR